MRGMVMNIKAVLGFMGLKNTITRFFRSSSGAVSPMMALMLIPILGAVGLAVDLGYWYQIQRSMQNAADSAAIAAAYAADKDAAQSGVYDYVNIARGTAAKLGFSHDGTNVKVNAYRDPSYCPAGVTGSCTKVTISKVVPLFFTPVAGFKGDQPGVLGQTVGAAATANSQSGGRSYCMTVLGHGLPATTPAFTAKGVPFANLGGCSIFSNTTMSCNGGNPDLNAAYAVTVSTAPQICGVNQAYGATPMTNPYDDYASKIPSDPCKGSYPQQPKKGSLPSTNLLSGTIASSGPKTMCGDVQLTSDVTITDPNFNLIIQNGHLDLNGHTIKTATNAGASIVFSGTTPETTTYSHIPIGSGTINISSPTSGDWQGVSMYQDPKLRKGLDITEAGNQPAWDISGIVYLPYSNVTLKGIVNKAGTGYNCFVLVANTVQINGTGQIFASPLDGCPSQGVNAPTDVSGGSKPWLVQ
jgi:hypothetical protein